MASPLHIPEDTQSLQPADPLPHLHAHSPVPQIDRDVGNFDCNICLGVCRDPVVTVCGHLFCWPCLYYCFSLHSTPKECPVCKADVQDKIVPLYGCGKIANSADSLAKRFPDIHIPCRPSAITSTTSKTSAITGQEYGPNDHEMHRFSARFPLLGFSIHALLRLAMACIPPQNVGRRAATILRRRRRYNNEKEFVLHWGFILMASVIISFFLLY